MSKPTFATTLIPVEFNPAPADRARLVCPHREQLEISRRASREKEDEVRRVRAELNRTLDYFMHKEEDYRAELRIAYALIDDLREQLAVRTAPSRPGPERRLRYKRVQRGPE